MKEERLKVGIFDLTPLNYYGGGCENSFIKMAGALSNKGYEVAVITPTFRFFKGMVSLSQIFYRTRIKLKIRESKKSIETRLGEAKWLSVPLSKMRRLLQNQDIIYTKNEILELLLLNLLFIRKPIISSVRTPLHYPLKKSLSSRFHNWLYSSRLYRFACRILQGAHVLNKRTQEEMKKFLPLNKIFLIPNWVDANFFSPETKIKKGKKFNILFVGRLSEQKGVNYLQKIIESLHQEKGFNFVIVGHGDQEYIIEKLSQKYINIEWFKNLNSSQLLKIYRKSNLFILPSRWESLPLVVLEAQSCALPVVAFDIPGVRDIVLNGKTGFLIEMGNVSKFVLAVKKMYRLYLEEGAEFDKLGINCRRNAITRFPKSKILQDMENMFLKTIRG